MNNKKIIFLLAFVFVPFLFSQAKKEIKIKVITADLPANSIVYISGNNRQLGNWNANIIRLNKKNKNTWEKSFYFKVGEIVKFKITRGSWDNERLDDDLKIPSNTILKVTNDTTITYAVNKWADQVERKITAHGQITGKVEYIRGLKGNGILPRDIIIWLPPRYEKNKKERYPVLYMHDGQNIIDPTTSSFGYDWRVDEVTDSLIKVGKINNVVIVGIYSTADRSLDYGGAKSNAYMNFLVNKVKSLIDKKYRTKPDRNNTAIAGSSLGGIISFMIIWKYPDVFSEAACLSPAFHIGEYNCIPVVRNFKGKKNVKIYIDNGSLGLEKELQTGVDEMLALLKLKGYVEGKDLEYYKATNAEHNEQAWAKRNWRWLEFLFGK
ncbi:MAG: alpha/beta hydrolase-fold protein [Ignavibacteriaceae bacterium]